MRAVIVVANPQGIVKFDCGAMSEALLILAEKLQEPAEVVDAVGMWSIHARPGDWCDLPRGYVFAVGGDPLMVDLADGATRH